MADVIPFKGILYNPNAITPMADVTAPPFDVISPAYQKTLYERHPNNVVRLILTSGRPDDRGDSDRHRRAGQTYKQWLSEGLLRRDNQAAFYLQETRFNQDGNHLNRFGLIACVRLEAFEKGIILPHEKTFSKVKSERLGLMRHCHANFSPIFSLYADNGAIIDSLKTAIPKSTALIDMTDDQNNRHRLYRLTAPHIQERITAAFTHERLYIADGHHRYETALHYRQWVAARTPHFSASHPANFVMMYLASMQDPGMIILPAHRLLHQVSEKALDEMLALAESYFDVEHFTDTNGDSDSLASEFLDRLRALSNENAIGLARKGRPELTLLRLKPRVMSERYGQEMAAELQDLDVSVLTRLIFMDLLGFDQTRLDNNELIGYSSSARAAVAAAQNETYDVAFILNPTRMSQVRRVSEAGLVMPRKSTYFFPKVLSGLVMNSLLEDEDLQQGAAAGSLDSKKGGSS
ncbi:MAG: DUF1015 domain-containing protein [Desulfosarcinaceae bacterium]|nr:DUF1015 domain-containing protein [Desulfosarcinaceae bacterium]